MKTNNIMQNDKKKKLYRQFLKNRETKLCNEKKTMAAKQKRRNYVEKKKFANQQKLFLYIPKKWQIQI